MPPAFSWRFDSHDQQCIADHFFKWLTDQCSLADVVWSCYFHQHQDSTTGLIHHHMSSQFITQYHIYHPNLSQLLWYHHVLSHVPIALLSTSYNIIQHLSAIIEPFCTSWLMWWKRSFLMVRRRRMHGIQASNNGSRQANGPELPL